MNNAQKFFDETLIKLAKQYEKKNFSKESVKVIIIKLPKNELLVEPKFTLEKEGYSENKNNEYKNWYSNEELIIEADLTGSLKLEGFANLNKIEICGQSITDLEIILIKETKGGYYRYPTDIKISSNNDLNSLKLIGVEEQAEVINNLFLTNSPNLNKFEFQNCLLKLESDFVIENFGNKNCTLPFLRFLQQPLKCSNKGDKNELLIKKILSFIEEIVWEIKKQKDQIVNLQTQLNLLENEKKNHSSEKSKTEEETNNFIQRIGQLKDDIANLKHDIQENSKKSQKEKEQLTANYSQEKQKLEQQTKEKEQKIKNLENKIKSKENKAVDLEKRIQESQEQINSLQAEINQQKQKLSLKDGDYDLLLSEKTKLEKKIKDLQDRNSTATITNEKEFSLDKVFGDKYKKYWIGGIILVILSLLTLVIIKKIKSIWH